MGDKARTQASCALSGKLHRVRISKDYSPRKCELGKKNPSYRGKHQGNLDVLVYAPGKRVKCPLRIHNCAGYGLKVSLPVYVGKKNVNLKL